MPWYLWMRTIVEHLKRLCSRMPLRNRLPSMVWASLKHSSPWEKWLTYDRKLEGKLWKGRLEEREGRLGGGGKRFDTGEGQVRQQKCFLMTSNTDFFCQVWWHMLTTLTLRMGRIKDGEYKTSLDHKGILPPLNEALFDSKYKCSRLHKTK